MMELGILTGPNFLLPFHLSTFLSPYLFDYNNGYVVYTTLLLVFYLLDYQATISNTLSWTFIDITAICGAPRLYVDQVHVWASIVLMCA